MISRIVNDFGPILSRARQVSRGAYRETGRLGEIGFFAVNWARDPFRMGSVVPSSRHLARAMVGCVEVGGGEAVLELGAGTGRLTAALLEAGLPPEQLVVIELDPSMVAWLVARFPGVEVIEGCATQASRLLPEARRGRIGSVVSGLPLRSMPVRRREEILGQAFAAMAPHGRFLQYSYGRQPPVDPGTLGLETDLVERVWQNFPPAKVWRYSRPLPEAA